MKLKEHIDLILKSQRNGQIEQKEISTAILAEVLKRLPEKIKLTGMKSYDRFQKGYNRSIDQMREAIEKK